MSLVEAFSQRVMIDKVFFVPNCVRLARLSHHLHRLLRQMWGAVPGPRVDDLSDKWGEELLSLERDKSSYLEKQSTRGKVRGAKYHITPLTWTNATRSIRRSLSSNLCSKLLDNATSGDFT